MSDVAKRNARNKRAGQRWQRDLLVGLRDEAGFDIERLALNGSEDEGDHVVRLPAGFWVPERIVVEAKAGEMHPAAFVRQALEEANHYAAHRGLPRESVLAIAAVKARGKNWKDAYVLTTVRELLRLGVS